MSAELEFREARDRDVPGMVDVVAGQPLWERYGVVPEKLTADLLSALSKEDLFLVGAQGDLIVGWAWWQRKGGFGASPYLGLIAVKRGSEGRGVGSALMAEAEGRLGPARRGLFLLVSDFNEAAQRFYERLGYRRVGRLPGFVLSDVAELIYWKPAHRSEEAGGPATVPGGVKE